MDSRHIAKSLKLANIPAQTAGKPQVQKKMTANVRGADERGSVVMLSQDGLGALMPFISGRQTSKLQESERRQLMIDKLPQRPETSTGAGTKALKKRTLQAVYG